MKHHWRFVTYGVFVPLFVGLTIGLTAPAPAAADQIIHFATPKLGLQGEPGSTAELGVAAVDDTDRGHDCKITIAVENNESVHLGNNLLVSSGGDTLLLIGPENTAGPQPPAVGHLRLGDTITAEIQFGADGVSSLAVNISTDCTPPPPPPSSSTTTTSQPPATSTTPPEQPPTTPRFTG